MGKKRFYSHLVDVGWNEVSLLWMPWPLWTLILIFASVRTKTLWFTHDLQVLSIVELINSFFEKKIAGKKISVFQEILMWATVSCWNLLRKHSEVWMNIQIFNTLLCQKPVQEKLVCLTGQIYWVLLVTRNMADNEYYAS